jgi:hypothetical protein
MYKFVKILLPAVFAAAMLSSCQSGNKDIRQEARQSIEGTGAVTPQNPNPMDPAAQPQNSPVPSGPTTEMVFTETEFDFGTVKEGEKVSHVYNLRMQAKNRLSFPMHKAAAVALFQNGRATPSLQAKLLKSSLNSTPKAKPAIATRK